MTIAELRQRAAGFLSAPSPPEQRGRFSAFRPDQLDEAVGLSGEFVRIANEKGGDEGLAAVLAAAEKERKRRLAGLVKYALELFITHDPLGRRLGLVPLEQAKPALVPPPDRAGLVAPPPEDPEAALTYFREDVLANEHHKHWHLVYPFRGPPAANGHPHEKERQGELFLYMHEQMLARYDAERRALGFDPVRPLESFTEPIAEGYDPHDPDRLSARPPNARIAADDLRDVLSAEDDRMRAAVADGRFKQNGAPGLTIEIDSLGAAVESSVASVVEWQQGGPHNDGHVAIASIHPPGAHDGAMMFTDTAIRDPVFWRWHRHIDDLSFAWQEHQPANDFSDAPHVRIRADGARPHESPDIILSLRDQLPGKGDDGFDGAEYAEQTFGGAHWDEAAAGDAVTSELQTMMVERTVTLEDGSKVPTVHLEQREFVYFVRVENLVDRDVEITLRLFIAPTVAAGDRRAWIEMDKFHQSLAPRQRAVVYRPSWLSSVIRKPAAKPARALPRAGGHEGDDPNYCDCGWPYNLLLPRGTREGMPFTLLVLATDWAIDKVAEDTHCGSMSFCGVRDRYPDTRAMGYPFDRPFPAGQAIAATLAGLGNAATRSLTVRWADS